MWVDAATSLSGPRANQPASSVSTAAAHWPGARRARRYSASDATGHSWRPVDAAARHARAVATRPSQSRPVGEAVDEAHELVGVVAADQPVELVPIHQTRGQG